MIAANSMASRSISRKLKSPQVRRHGPDDDIHTLCPSCGQLYRNADIERDGEAPIIDTVDVGVTAFLVSLRRREIAPIEHAMRPFGALEELMQGRCGRPAGRARRSVGWVNLPVFRDKASGRDTDRPQLTELLRFARDGDTVVVHNMDRLARNLDDLRALELPVALAKKAGKPHSVTGAQGFHRCRTELSDGDGRGMYARSVAERGCTGGPEFQLTLQTDTVTICESPPQA